MLPPPTEVNTPVRPKPEASLVFTIEVLGSVLRFGWRSPCDWKSLCEFCWSPRASIGRTELFLEAKLRCGMFGPLVATWMLSSGITIDG